MADLNVVRSSDRTAEFGRLFHCTIAKGKNEYFKKLKGINDFSFQLRKTITSYRRIGYNLNVMQQSACLVFNPIMVDNYAAFFNCTPVGRASDSMMAPT